MNKRLDAALVARGLAGGRDRAKEWIAGGMVSVNGVIVTKPSTPVEDEDEVCCLVRSAFVGRGGEKLEKALTLWNLPVNGVIAADIGASTGGFTDCLLRHGAAKVYAIDVGRDQLHPSLREDARVVSLEGQDVRDRTRTAAILPDGSVRFVCVDVSFISLRQIWHSVIPLLQSDGMAVCLIKPQFEAGRQAIGKHGVVKDAAVHLRVLQELCAFFDEGAWKPQALTHSPICGGDGNVEYLILLGQSPAPALDVATVVTEAWADLRKK